MARIEYTKTKFNKPHTPSETEFIKLKDSYFKNPNYKPFQQSESFTEHFSDTIKLIKYGFFIGIAALITIGINETVGSILSFIAIPLFFFSLIFLFLEGPSYASFLKDKVYYEERLK